MRLNKKGYMLIEIILAMTIAFVMLFFVFELVIKLKNKNDDLFAETVVTTDTTIINNSLFEYAKDEAENFDCSKLTIDDDNVLRYRDNVINKINEYTDVGQIKCSNNLGKISITIPLRIAQMSDKEYDVLFDYKYKEPVTMIETTEVYLFDNGKDNTELTGGWGGSSCATGLATPSGYSGPLYNYLYATADSMTIMYDDAFASFYSNSPVDLSNYETIHFLVDESSGRYEKRIGVVRKGKNHKVDYYCNKPDFAESRVISAPGEYVIDISDLTGTYFISSLVFGVGGEGHQIKVSKIWLTRPDNTYPIKINGTQIGTYSGRFDLIEEDSENWKIKFISSGNLVLNSSINVDIFVVGGGGGGGELNYENCDHGHFCREGGGGGGGYTKTYSNETLGPGQYEIVIGTGGAVKINGGASYLGSSTMYYAEGGKGSDYDQGGDGGSGGGSGKCCRENTSVNHWTVPGGKGGIYGASGNGCYSDCAGYMSNNGGTGQGTTTCEFGEGTTSGCNSGVTAYSQGGNYASSIDNSGNGGNVGGVGSSGIVIIRNKR